MAREMWKGLVARGLSEEHLPFVQECKEEEMSDSELIESSCDEENEDQTCYPSESAVEEWTQGKEKKSEHQESLKQGLSEGQLQFVQQCNEDELSDSELIESSCDEENEDQTWYPSETTVEEWTQGKEKKNEDKESLKQGVSEEQLQFVQQCKEEELSDSELIESSCDEENEDQTWYPSETAVEEWMQAKEKENDLKESLKQDLSEEQLKFVQQCKEEEVSDSEFIESSCDEENEDQTWYPSESDVEEWKEEIAKRNEYKESLKQGHYLPQIVNLCFG